MSDMQPSKRNSFLIFLLAWLVAASYLAVNLKRGWVPHDEGALAQSAERILQGELPHRDFDEPYTGGLSYLHALDFRLFGINLISLRYGLFCFFVLWVPAVFAIAREFQSPWPAAGITLFAVAWSVPNYAASVPSWYCLFFATFGSLALLRYIRAPQALWLALAGLCGGLSCLMKTHGVLFVAGALLFLVYREQSLSQEQRSPRQRFSAYSLFVFACLALFAAAILRMLRNNLDVSEIVTFVVPPFAVVGLLVARQLRPAMASSSTRFRQLFGLCLPFLAGFAAPTALFFSLFAAHRGLHDLAGALFSRALKHAAVAQLPPPHWILVVPAIVLEALLSMRQRLAGARLVPAALAVFVAAILFFSVFWVTPIYLLALYAAWCAIPVLSIVVVCVIGKNGAPTSEQAFLLLAVTVLCSLIQFPFAAPVYFLYVAPLAILCISLVVAGLPQLNRVPLVVSAAFFACYAVFALRPTFLFDMNTAYHPDEQTVPLRLPRAGGLRVSKESATDYQQLIVFLTEYARGRPILAGPDCPQVYFLSGSPNPTPILFEYAYDPREYRRIVEPVLDRPDFIQIVVINDDPEFSKPERSILHELISGRFRQVSRIGVFTVFARR